MLFLKKEDEVIVILIDHNIVGTKSVQIKNTGVTSSSKGIVKN